MTTPAQARSSKSGDIRTYAWPPQPPHEFEVVSVTTAIGKGLPKPFLIGWAAKVAAECAVDDIEIVKAMIDKGNARAAVDHIKGARFRDMGEKADRGTIVHAALESYLDGKALKEDEIKERLREARVPGKMWKSAIGMVNGLMEFLFDEEPEVFWSEATVYSRQHGYGGTADLIARMRVGDSLEPVVIDVKTSKRIYDETALQLCAYGRADFVGLDDGTEAKLLPAKVKKPIEHGVVVRPMASGKYEKAVFTLTDEVFDLFLHCLGVATGQEVLGRVRRP